MSHIKRKVSVKRKDLSMHSSHMKVKERSCIADVSVPNCSSVCHRTEKQGSQKVKRLKTFKERNRIQGQSSYRSNHIHQHNERACKEKYYRGHECQCSRSLTYAKREKPVAKPFRPQKPSIITEGRLTSIRGLFSHEVRSVDIERLVRGEKRQKGQVTAKQSPCQSPPSVLSDNGDGDICTVVQETQVLKTLELTDHTPTNLEGSDKRNKKSKNKTTESENLSCQKQPETIVLTSSESDIIHKSSSKSSHALQNNHISPITPNPPTLHNNDQTSQTTSVIEKLHSKVKDVLQSDSIFTITHQRPAEKEIHPRMSEPSPDMEAVGRVAARLCHSLRSFLKRRHRPLQAEVKEILFQCMQERHGSQFEHNLQKLGSHVSAEEPRSPLNTKQAWPSSAQSSEDTCTYFNNIDLSGNEDFQKGKFSQDYCERDNFIKNSGIMAQCRKRRTDLWSTNTPQEFPQKLQQSSPERHTAFPRLQIPKPTSYSWTDFTSGSLFLQPQKHLYSGEIKARHFTSLLEQYRHDPDFGFLWSNTSDSVSPLKEIRVCSPYRQFNSETERSLCASSSASPFFSSKGFRYEPFFRFPHPPFNNNSSIPINRSERSGKSHYTQLDVNGHSSTYFSNPYYIPNWPCD